MTLGDLVPWGRKDRDLAPPQDELRYRSGEVSPFMRLHQEMNRLFDDVFRDFGFPSARQYAAWPQIEVSETGDGYRLTAELPGLDQKDVEISLQDGVLVVRGEKRSESDDDRRGYSERRYGMFERSIQVGDIDEDKVHATFDKGVLTITLPKSPQAQDRVKRIAINAPTQH
jgi:HSP20 family protein